MSLQNIQILTKQNNVFDSAVVTASTIYSSLFPASNVQSNFVKKVWQSSGLSSEWLKFDLGSSLNVQMFSFFYNNLTSNATVKLYGSATDLGNTEAAWAGAAYSTTISASAINNRSAYLSLNQTFRWWLLTFTDSGNSNGYVNLGRVFGGVPVTPAENFNENFQEDFMDPSIQNWTVGGSLYSTVYDRYKNIQYQFLDLAQADQTILRNVYNQVFMVDPMAIAFDPLNEPANLTLYCSFTSPLKFSWTPNQRLNCAMSVREWR